MTQTSEPFKKARRELIQQTIDKISKIQNFSEFRTSVRVILMHLWLHIKADEESLFEGDEWSHPECRDELIEKIKEFLNRNIR